MPTHKDLGFEQRQKELKRKRREREIFLSKLLAFPIDVRGFVSKIAITGMFSTLAAFGIWKILL